MKSFGRAVSSLFVVAMLCCASAVGAVEFRVVGTELPPLMYTVDGVPAGFYVELLAMMITEMNDVGISIQFYPAERMFLVLQAESNTLSLGVARNSERETLYKWVGPIYPRVFSAYKLKSRTDVVAGSLADIKGYKLGVGRGYAVNFDVKSSGVSDENIDESPSDAYNVKKLLANRVDFVVMNDVMIAYLLQQEGYGMEAVERLFVVNAAYAFYFAFNKDFDDTRVAAFQNALDTLKRDGRHAALVQRYFH